jgi:hypothetical protein
MKSNQDIIREDMARYTMAGYSVHNAARQISAMRPGKHWARLIREVTDELTADNDTYESIYQQDAQMAAEFEQAAGRG